MLNFLTKSEGLVRQLASAVSSYLPNLQEETSNAIAGIALSQLVDDTPTSLAQAIFAVCDYSSQVLSPYPTIQYSIDDEVLETLWNLGEEITQYENISVAQETVADWVEDMTGW